MGSRHHQFDLEDRYQLNRIEQKLDLLLEVVTEVATDQATFEAALTEFLTDLETGLAAIQAKLDAGGTSVDLSTELAQINDAKAKFDAQVAADTAPPAV